MGYLITALLFKTSFLLYPETFHWRSEQHARNHITPSTKFKYDIMQFPYLYEIAKIEKFKNENFAEDAKSNL